MCVCSHIVSLSRVFNWRAYSQQIRDLIEMSRISPCYPLPPWRPLNLARPPAALYDHYHGTHVNPSIVWQCIAVGQCNVWVWRMTMCPRWYYIICRRLKRLHDKQRVRTAARLKQIYDFFSFRHGSTAPRKADSRPRFSFVRNHVKNMLLF